MDSSKKILLLLFVSVVSAAADGFFDRHTRSERSNAYADQPARPYSYEYSVNDDYEGTKFNARESADGKVVTGSYQVTLTLQGDRENQSAESMLRCVTSC